jgi:hypothetical protein
MGGPQAHTNSVSLISSEALFSTIDTDYFRFARHSAKDGYKVPERRISGGTAKSFRVWRQTVKVNLA